MKTSNKGVLSQNFISSVGTSRGKLYPSLTLISVNLCTVLKY